MLSLETRRWLAVQKTWVLMLLINFSLPSLVMYLSNAQMGFSEYHSLQQRSYKYYCEVVWPLKVASTITWLYLNVENTPVLLPKWSHWYKAVTSSCFNGSGSVHSVIFDYFKEGGMRLFLFFVARSLEEAAVNYLFYIISTTQHIPFRFICYCFYITTCVFLYLPLFKMC